MHVLLDTHTFLWFAEGSSRLSATAAQLVREPANIRVLSMASLWEIAIKASQGRMTFVMPFDEWVAEALDRTGTNVLETTIQHLNVVSTLSFHHRDPFDRLIIAQAIAEGYPVASTDEAFDAYPITRIW